MLFYSRYVKIDLNSSNNHKIMLKAETSLMYNKELSSQKKEEPKYKLFVEWCIKNGMIWTGVDFPAFFGDSLRGMVATRDIKPYEGLIYLPNSLIITVEKVRKDKILGSIVEKYPKIFMLPTDSEYNVLALFLLRERMKGTRSFWYDYLNLVPEIGSGVEWPPEIVEQIEDARLKGEIVEAKQELLSEWNSFKAVLDEYPNLFERVRIEDYLWAMQFVSSRCFGWYLPSTLLAPMIDMINHYSDDMCTTEVIQLDLEMEPSEEKREAVNYRRLRKRFDLRAILPKAKFGKKTKKSQLIHFYDTFTQTRDYKDHRILNDEQELSLSLKAAEGLLVSYTKIHIWHIPKLIPDEDEDNDSSDEDDTEQDQDYDDYLRVLRGIISEQECTPSSTKTGLKNPPPTEDDIELMRQSFYKRKEIFDIEISKTHKPTDYTAYTKAIQEKVEESEGDDSYSENQEKFPWYNMEDDKFYFIVANNRNKIIPKGTEIKITYGQRNNKYLLTYYGFGLKNNLADSLTFRMLLDSSLEKIFNLPCGVVYVHTSYDDLENKEVLLKDGQKLNLDFVSKEFRAKHSAFCDDLLSFLRASNWTRYAIAKSLGTYENMQFKVTTPFNLEFEKEIVEKYISIFTTLSMQYKRSAVQDDDLIKDANTDWRIKMIATVEQNYKLIAEEQIRLGRILLSILNSFKSKDDMEFKAKYMKRIDSFDEPGDEKLIARLKLSNYLKSFYLSKWIN